MSKLASRELLLFALLTVGMLLAATLEPRFVTVKSQLLLASHLWELAIVALPMLLIIIIGGIDLSVGSIVAIAGVTLGLTFEAGMPPFLAAGCAVLGGTLAGYLNGKLVTKLRVHPLIVTLATMAAYRGTAEGMSRARPLSGYPESFLHLSQGTVLGVPFPAVTFLLLALLTWFILAKLRIGRWIIALGTEEAPTRFSGIPVDRLKTALYTFSGLACGIAAVFLVARNNTAKADMGMGMELEAITAVVLGGASIEGGKGKVLGLVLALFLIHETREFVSWHWKQSELNLLVMGSLLILALLTEQLVERRSKLQPA